ncbi:endonuclease [Acrocarpospora pleiomorpha]|uniref:Endonuclease n=1 Tax=Acrocarpospora pleiomorpha TaxID=90975 RepID=A0A5M3XEV2_9ACTN|nr:endonuclease/exonuclease/phosphatase family protein [Acrocarpospora pleiomorpha]GES19794.1 endonuclease [Acrocarpospora pleiomorpha]
MALDTEEVAAASDSVARPRRRWVTVCVWLVVAVFGLWAALRLLPWDVHFAWVQLVAFTPTVALLSLIAPILALLLRRWIALAAGLAVCAVFATAVLPRAFPGSNSAASGPPLRVLAANLKVGSVPPDALITLVRDLRPDILAVQELTPTAAENLRTAGLGELLPFYAGEARAGVGGSGIYSRHPLQLTDLIDFGGFGQARATVQLPGARVDVVSVHPCAPSQKSLYQCWADGLTALPNPDNTPKILLGDFNATLDHARVRALLATGYQDAADTTASGLTTTWPATPWTFHGLPIPSVTLDHIVVDQHTAVHKFTTHLLPETDHRAVYAELTLAAK